MELWIDILSAITFCRIHDQLNINEIKICEITIPSRLSTYVYIDHECYHCLKGNTNCMKLVSLTKIAWNARHYSRFLFTASVPGICDKYSALPLNRLLISFPLPTLNFAASFNFQTFHSQSSEYIRVFIQISQLEVTWHKYFSAEHIFCLLSQFS